jgi:Tfp pilus assembly protein PilF
MADTLITRLSGLSGLTVRPLGSVLVAAAGGEDLDALAAGRRLRVDHVLEGSLQRDGPRVRVSVRLLRVADGEAVWAEVMEEEGLGLFELQDAISERLIARLAPASSPEERRRVARRLTDDEEAYRAYVRGRYFFEREDPENLRRALAEFRRAVELDPGFALAHAGITHAYAPLLTWGWMPNSEGLEPAQAAAFRALELDDGLAEVHTAVAIAHSLDWDWRAEEASYRRAIALNPHYPTAHNWLGFLLTAQGRHEEARVVLERAHGLDPTGLIPNVLLASTLEGEEAEAQLERTLELDPDYHWTLASLGELSWSRGDLRAAKAWFERAGSRESAACVGVELGEPEEARQLLAELRREAATRYVSPYDTAVLHACLNETDRAFADLERAYDERLSTLMTLAIDRRLVPLSADPRYADLVGRVGLRAG